MSRLHSVLLLACVIALPTALGGCAGVVVVGGLAAAAGGGYAAAQERGLSTAAVDFTVKTDIEKAFLKTDQQLQVGITTSVYNGRVLLTGRVPTPEMKATAVQIASRMHDVRAVYDEVEVLPHEGIWDGTKDAWITARVRSELVVDPDIRSVNYTIDTENGSVYLIGTARSQAELDRVTRIARYVPGVQRVVSYVELREGVPLAARPAPAAAPVLSDRPNAAPRQPVEVEKL